MVYIYIQRNELKVMNEMKIALQVGAPEPSLLNDFMQSYAGSDAVYALGQAAAAGNVISAYDDNGTLVGIGSRVQSPDQKVTLKTVIAPGYERRGISDNMAKLLLQKNERLNHAG